MAKKKENGNTARRKMRNGMKFGAWTIVDAYPSDNAYCARCVCFCGAVRLVRRPDLHNGATKSCRTCWSNRSVDAPNICSVSACGGRGTAGGLCAKHYARKRKHGSEHYERPKGRAARLFIAGLGYCAKCAETKPLAEFAYDGTSRRGVSAWCKLCAAEKTREYYKRKPEVRLAQRLRRYGLSTDDYRRLLEKQQQRCAICRLAPPTGQRLHVDHSHATGEVRGLSVVDATLALGSSEMSRRCYPGP